MSTLDTLMKIAFIVFAAAAFIMAMRGLLEAILSFRKRKPIDNPFYCIKLEVENVTMKRIIAENDAKLASRFDQIARLEQIVDERNAALRLISNICKSTKHKNQVADILKVAIEHGVMKTCSTHEVDVAICGCKQATNTGDSPNANEQLLEAAKNYLIARTVETRDALDAAVKAMGS